MPGIFGSGRLALVVGFIFITRKLISWIFTLRSENIDLQISAKHSFYITLMIENCLAKVLFKHQVKQ